MTRRPSTAVSSLASLPIANQLGSGGVNQGLEFNDAARFDDGTLLFSIYRYYRHSPLAVLSSKLWYVSDQGMPDLIKTHGAQKT